jgi:hypothetical protein
MTQMAEGPKGLQAQKGYLVRRYGDDNKLKSVARGGKPARKRAAL